MAATTVVASKGKKVVSFEADETSSDACVDAMLGPTGNLRAPTIKTGDTVLVGFNESVFTERFD